MRNIFNCLNTAKLEFRSFWNNKNELLWFWVIDAIYVICKILKYNSDHPFLIIGYFFRPKFPFIFRLYLYESSVLDAFLSGNGLFWWRLIKEIKLSKSSCSKTVGIKLTWFSTNIVRNSNETIVVSFIFIIIEWWI